VIIINLFIFMVYVRVLMVSPCELDDDVQHLQNTDTFFFVTFILDKKVPFEADKQNQKISFHSFIPSSTIVKEED